MNEWPKVAALLITYQRTHVARRTVLGVRTRLAYPGPIQWILADDGSDRDHLAALYEAMGEEAPTSVVPRKGAGASMNKGMDLALREADYILWLEDDWELQAPFDLTPCVQLLQEREDLGMIRLGYISPGLQAELVDGAGRLWWRLRRGPTYTFCGHASLRHRRFCQAYGYYQEGLTPGETELWYCGTFNHKPGPDIVLPAWTGEWGAFSHIGGQSLKDMRPE